MTLKMLSSALVLAGYILFINFVTSVRSDLTVSQLADKQTIPQQLQLWLFLGNWAIVPVIVVLLFIWWTNIQNAYNWFKTDSKIGV